jgi:fluoride exporter
MSWALVALGAAAGAPCRFLLDGAVTARWGRRLPWGTLVVNLLGSTAAGLLAGLALGRGVAEPVLALVGVGFLSAFTTASTFAWEVVTLAEDGSAREALLTVVLSVVLGVLLAGAGAAVGLAV